jgi:hypothetical protein
VVIAHIGAEVAFQRPERDDHRGGHAVLLLDALEHLGIGLDLRLAHLDAVAGGHAVGKFQKCLGEDALAAIDIDDALIVSEKRRGLADRALRYALRHGFALEIGEPFLVGPAGPAWRGRRCRAARHDADQENSKDNYFATEHFRYQSKISSPFQCSTPLNLRT